MKKPENDKPVSWMDHWQAITRDKLTDAEVNAWRQAIKPLKATVSTSDVKRAIDMACQDWIEGKTTSKPGLGHVTERFKQLFPPAAGSLDPAIVSRYCDDIAKEPGFGRAV